ncbi:MAG: hypothetical protein ABIH11_00200 [Candidatus Altiarchaeota archaeon]
MSYLASRKVRRYHPNDRTLDKVDSLRRDLQAERVFHGDDDEALRRRLSEACEKTKIREPALKSAAEEIADLEAREELRRNGVRPRRGEPRLADMKARFELTILEHPELLGQLVRVSRPLEVRPVDVYKYLSERNRG